MIRYELTPQDAFGDFVARIQKMIVSDGLHHVCEVGAGANPALSLDFIRTHDVDYLATDIAPEELAKAPAGYSTLALDAAAATFASPAQFDLVFSRAVAEHVRDPATFHRNVLALLAPGGRAVHHFSTLYELPFVVNRSLPDAVSGAILRRLDPRRGHEGKEEKFPAYYRWCRGPTARQIARFESTGFRLDEFVGFFGHFYFARIPALQRLEDRAARWLLGHPAPLLTSCALVVLSKPAS